MKIHIDWPWGFDVRTYGAPIRAYVHTKDGMWLIGAKSQARIRGEYGDTFRRITFHPTRDNLWR